MSVNDAANNWRALEHADGSEWPEAMRTPEGGAVARGCANDLDKIAKNAWHPVSQPPTKEDGDSNGFVLTWDESGEIDMYEWRDLYFPPRAEEIACWARIRDVVLLPEKSF